MKAMLFVNPRSGDGSPDAGELEAAARERGVEVHVLAEGDDLVELARSADAEVLGMADRVLVMHEGRITGEVPRAEADEERIMRAATGRTEVAA